MSGKPVTDQPTYNNLSSELPWALPLRGLYKPPGANVIIPGRSSPRDPGGVALEYTEDLSPGFRSGLEDLDKVDVVSINQRMSHDVDGRCGIGNTYDVISKSGAKLFHVAEDSNCLCRWLCGPNRLMRLMVYNRNKDMVLQLERACCRCDMFCCFDTLCCQQKLLINDASGRALGEAKQRFRVFGLSMDVTDAYGTVFSQLRGPCCPCRCCTEINLDILDSARGREMGYIFKRYVDQPGPVNSDHEHFEISFPQGQTAQQKASILGAAFLANAMYFEMS